MARVSVHVASLAPVPQSARLAGQCCCSAPILRLRARDANVGSPHHCRHSNWPDTELGGHAHHHPVPGIAGERREVETRTAGSRGTLASSPPADGAGRIVRTVAGACRGGCGGLRCPTTPLWVRSRRGRSCPRQLIRAILNLRASACIGVHLLVSALKPSSCDAMAERLPERWRAAPCASG